MVLMARDLRTPAGEAAPSAREAGETKAGAGGLTALRVREVRAFLAAGSATVPASTSTCSCATPPPSSPSVSSRPCGVPPAPLVLGDGAARRTLSGNVEPTGWLVDEDALKEGSAARQAMAGVPLTARQTARRSWRVSR
jgi:hypothetical protein